VSVVPNAGANREHVAFDDIALCAKPIFQPASDKDSTEDDTTPAAAVGAAAEVAAAAEAGAEGEVKLQNTRLTWKKIATEGDVPQPRSGHATVSYGNYLFLFGGIDFAEESTFSDLYILNLTTWTWKYVGEAGAEIEARNSHSLGILHVPLRNSTYVAAAAGCSSSSSGSSSSGATSSTVNARKDSTCTFIPYLVVFGGASVEKGPLGDTFYAALPECLDDMEREEFHVVWAELAAGKEEEMPLAREMHSTSLLFGSMHGSQYGTSSMFIVGGRGLDMVLGDVWELRPAPLLDNAPEEVSSEMTNAATGGANAATIAAAKALNKKLLQWVPREDLDMNTGRCAHGAAVLDTGDGNALLSLCGGFTGASIAEDVSCISLGSYDREIDTVDNTTADGGGSGATEIDITESLQLPSSAAKWRGTRCGAAVGSRFGIAVCTAPKWLLDAKFPENEKTNVDDGAMIMYGGINMEKDYGDLLLLLPPTA